MAPVHEPAERRQAGRDEGLEEGCVELGGRRGREGGLHGSNKRAGGGGRNGAVGLSRPADLMGHEGRVGAP